MPTVTHEPSLETPEKHAPRMNNCDVLAEGVDVTKLARFGTTPGRDIPQTHDRPNRDAMRPLEMPLGPGQGTRHDKR